MRADGCLEGRVTHTLALGRGEGLDGVKSGRPRSLHGAGRMRPHASGAEPNQRIDAFLARVRARRTVPQHVCAWRVSVHACKGWPTRVRGDPGASV